MVEERRPPLGPTRRSSPINHRSFGMDHATFASPGVPNTFLADGFRSGRLDQATPNSTNAPPIAATAEVRSPKRR